MNISRVSHSILAAGDAWTYIKIIGGLIFLLYIMAGSLMGGKKPGRPGEKRRSWEEILRDMADKATQKPGEAKPRSWDQILGDITQGGGSKPAAPPSAPTQYPPTHRHTPPPLPQQRQARPKVVQRKRKVAAPQPAVAMEPQPLRELVADVAVVRATGAVAAPMSAPAASAAAPRVRAQAMAKLLRPASLRQQILVSEILRPPLTMREE